MEGSRPCQSCRKRTLVPDDVTGNMVCSSCGVVQDFDNFQAHIGGVTGEAGTYVRVGTVGSGSVRNYKENKIFEAQKLIEDFMFKLGLSGTKSHEGKWFPVFVGACAYVVMRKDQKMLPIVEVADLVGCDVYELGRMISRVVDFIDLKLPEFDIVKSFERAIKSCPSFGNVPEDVVQRMLQQGCF
ncbi:UNVERIFIED_CONTAM: Plant-specific TFIIB-related protein PTF2 [Sesamum radiatum]|uniref:Plant-specific TFIIB-related protein PTF2 n=1 Tax=Sesamum radiatum TaxID=300843 RepID=A0AAW2T251_SESRA